MPDYASTIAGVAGTEADVKYNGTVLTNGGDHTFITGLGTKVDTTSKTLTMPSGSMAGATASAIDAKLGETRTSFEKVADGLSKIASAAQKASPSISSGTSKDAAVQEALKTSSAVYNEVAGTKTGDTRDVAGTGGPTTGGKGTDDKGKGTSPGEKKETDTKGTDNKGKGSTPKTNVSSDSNQNPQQQNQGAGQQQGGGGQQQQPGGQQGQGQQQPAGGQGAGGMQQPGGQQRPGGSSPSTGVSADELRRMIAEEKAKAGSGTKPSSDKPGIKPERGHTPSTDISGGGSNTTVAAVPVGNPSVVGGGVDPAQTAGRTTSTASGVTPGATAAKPSASPMGTGMMGGMGMGGMPMGGQGGSGAGASTPVAGPRRDKISERIFTGEASRDKALISTILRDGENFTADPDVDEDDDDGLAEHRNPPRPEIKDDEKW